MDTLLRKLRQHMAELSVQGDDFTRQMWQMYAIFEDLLQRQNIAPNTLPAEVHAWRSAATAAPHPSATIQLTSGGSGESSNAPIVPTLEDYELWYAMLAPVRHQPDPADDSDDSETDAVKRGIRKELANEMRHHHHQMVLAAADGDSTTELDSDDVLERERGRSVRSHHLYHQELPQQQRAYSESIHSGPTSHGQHQRSLRRHRHRPRRRLPATPTPRHPASGATPLLPTHHRQNHHRYHSDYGFVEELTRSSPAINTVTDEPDATLDVYSQRRLLAGAGQPLHSTTDDAGKAVWTPPVVKTASTKPQNLLSATSTAPYRRSSAPELLDNPLLDTINACIEDLQCESDDYGELPSGSGLLSGSSITTSLQSSSNNSSGVSMDKEGLKTPVGTSGAVKGAGNKSEASSSTEERAQHSSDGDRDSVGYAGSNSVDSGYKSSCPTPELLDPCYYAQDVLCNGGSSRIGPRSGTQPVGRSGDPVKPRMGTRVIAGRHRSPHHHQHHQHQHRGSVSSASSASSGSAVQVSSSASGTPSPTLTSTLQSPSGSIGSGSGRLPAVPPPSSETVDVLGAGAISSTSVGNGAGKGDYGYYDINLDHLMYLRQSLLSAIQRCGVSSTLSPPLASPTTHQPLTSSPSAVVEPDAGRSRAGSRGSPDSKRPASHGASPTASQVSSSPARLSPTPSGSSSRSHTPVNAATRQASRITGREASNSAPSSPSKTTLQQRINVETHPRPPPPPSHRAGSASDAPTPPDAGRPTLEEEIDRILLYGRAEYYDLENVQEFPCSYGTMLEHKNRRSSLARVKKLKELSDARESELDKRSTQTKTAYQQFLQQQSTRFYPSTQPLSRSRFSSGGGSSPLGHRVLRSPTDAREGASIEEGGVRYADGRTAGAAPPVSGFHERWRPPETEISPPSLPEEDKSRFSEVAQCMLKIIDDIQHQKHQSGSEPAPVQHQKNLRSPEDDYRHLAYDSGRLVGADYHVYEEIAYDVIAIGGNGGHLEFKMAERTPPPPPLPARPSDLLLGGVDTDATSVTPVQQQPGTRQQATDASKLRRGNLYSLFTEQSERRHLSKSLEREWRASREPQLTSNTSTTIVDDDEYGFNTQQGNT